MEEIKRRKRRHRRLTGEDIDMFRERESETRKKEKCLFVIGISMAHNTSFLFTVIYICNKYLFYLWK